MVHGLVRAGRKAAGSGAARNQHPAGRHDIRGVVRALVEPPVWGEHQLGGRGIKPRGPPGKCAVRDGEMFTERHQADLVVGVPRFDAAHKLVRARRRELAGHGLDVVRENIERCLRAALAE